MQIGSKAVEPGGRERATNRPRVGFGPSYGGVEGQLQGCLVLLRMYLGEEVAFIGGELSLCVPQDAESQVASSVSHFRELSRAATAGHERHAAPVADPPAFIKVPLSGCGVGDGCGDGVGRGGGEGLGPGEGRGGGVG